MSSHRISELLRRLYLAASELHWGILLAVVLTHMSVSYGILAYASETTLQGASNFFYWYATTALTVGYGDLAPQTALGRIAAAAFVMPGAIGCFTVTVAKLIDGFTALWRKNRMGLGDFKAMKEAIVLIGYDRDRTPRMIAEIIADSRERPDIVLMTRQELDNLDPRYRYVRASSLTSTADLTRAGVPDAAKIVIFAQTDEQTLSAALAVTALNTRGHIVCYFREAQNAALLHAHCPRVEMVLSPTVELVVKALSDPGSSQLLTALASHTEEGATLYTAKATVSGSFADMAARLRAFHAVLVAFDKDGDDEFHFDFEGEIAKGDKLFYIAIDRLPKEWA